MYTPANMGHEMLWSTWAALESGLAGLQKCANGHKKIGGENSGMMFNIWMNKKCKTKYIMIIYAVVQWPQKNILWHEKL